MRLLWAFFKRDARIALSYRVSFAMQLAGNVLILGLFYYIGKIFGDQPLPALEAYGGNFLAYLLIGIALTDCVGVSLFSFASQIREAQTKGTLEATLMSPVRLSTIVVYSSLWNYFMCAVRFLFYLILGGALYGVDLSQANLLSALTIFALTILCFMGIGILWAGMVVLIKRGESIITVVGTLVLMVSGVFYPTHLLPDWMRTLSEVIPLTHALDGMRHALLQGFSLSELSDVTLTLGLFAILLMAMGLSSFNLSVRIGKQTGSLTQY